MRTGTLHAVGWAVALFLAGHAQAQTIEKMKLTDGGLTCAQLYAESLQMEQVMRTGTLNTALPAGTAANPYGINTQAIAAQAQAAGQQLAQDPQVMALAQQYAAKAQAGTLTPQEQQQYAMMMMQNPAVQQQMQGMTGNILGQMQASGAINQGMAQAMQQGMAQLPNAAAQGYLNGNVPALSGAGTNALAAGAAAGGGTMHPEMAQMRSLMLQSNDPKIRAGANDPMSIAQFAVILKNPNLAQAVARGQAAGVGAGFIQSQITAAATAQLSAWGASAGTSGGGILGQAAAPAAVPPQAPANALGGLFGALAAAKGGNPAGNQQAANLFGSLFAGAQQNQQQAAAPQVAPAVAPNNAALSAQAQARKEHLTSMFLSKGCKLSDIKR